MREGGKEEGGTACTGAEGKHQEMKASLDAALQ